MEQNCTSSVAPSWFFVGSKLVQSFSVTRTLSDDLEIVLCSRESAASSSRGDKRSLPCPVRETLWKEKDGDTKEEDEKVKIEARERQQIDFSFSFHKISADKWIRDCKHLPLSSSSVSHLSQSFRTHPREGMASSRIWRGLEAKNGDLIKRMKSLKRNNKCSILFIYLFYYSPFWIYFF